MKFFNQVKRDHKIYKTFNYLKGNIKLDFSLRVDTKSELQTFKELLLKAIEDIEQEIKI